MARVNIDLVAERKERKRNIRDEVGKDKSDETKNPNTCRRRRVKSGQKRLFRHDIIS